MLFSAIEFWLFYPVVFVLYWFVTQRSLRLQNGMLLVASYFFYGCWDWRFLLLLGFSTLLDYSSGLLIHRTTDKRRKRFWLATSVTVNLGLLGVFKYFNFFTSSFADLVGLFGLEADPVLLDLILPVGISFYTFHGLSYVLDVYHDRIEPTRDLGQYALFVGFFPLLVAGPIERATNLLPQLKVPRRFELARAVDGARQVLWGLVKKVVIADNCAPHVNAIFGDSEMHSGPVLVLGAFLFAVQLYGDFAGYSDIALGTARMLGIELLRNFHYPFFSRDIPEFWRRWHISLTTWFRDYVYFPLGGAHGGVFKRIRNLCIVFFLSGLWHGANWTFIAWVSVNALVFVPRLVTRRRPRRTRGIVAQGRLFPSGRDAVAMLTTFTFSFMAGIFFRATSMDHAMQYYGALFSGMFDLAAYKALVDHVIVHIGHMLPLLILAFFAVEWLGREAPYPIARMPDRWPRPVRLAFYYLLCFAVVSYVGTDQEFVYFQF